MRQQELQRLISRRALIFGGVQAAAGVALLSRLYYLQFVHGAEFKTLAEGNRAKLQLMIPPRGIIADRYGVELATNHVNYRVLLDADKRAAAREALQQLETLLQLTEREVKLALELIARRKKAVPVLVREHLTWEEVARLQFHLPELPLVLMDEGTWRHYPFADHASHLIGYVGKVAEGEVQDDQPLLKLPDMKIGKNGVELRYEERLQGKAGAKQIEVNAAGSPVRELNRTPPVAGDRLDLTIDSRLQEYAVEKLGEESGAIVVMDVNSGEVLALASMPAFDPNEFSKGIKYDYYQTLRTDKKIPLMNKAIAGQYPPGSTFKMITGLAGLKSGAFKASTRVHCSGVFYLGNRPFRCWKKGGHGTVDMADALAGSCDTYFYTVAREAGIDAVADIAHAFGLGQKPGLGLIGEKQGIVPSPAWKRSVGRGVWNPGETINTGIGQGDTLTTPLQLAIMGSRIANGGKKIWPRLLMDEAEKIEGQIDIDPEHLAVIREGMYRVTNTPQGTAFGSTIADAHYAFAGKTGTSQVRRLLVEGQDQKKLPWEFRHHAWFVGYAPVHAPKYCCSVIIEHGGGGASAAAPVARDMLLKVQQLREDPPVPLQPAARPS